MTHCANCGKNPVAEGKFYCEVVPWLNLTEGSILLLSGFLATFWDSFPASSLILYGLALLFLRDNLKGMN